MSEIQEIGSPEGLSVYDFKEENLEKALKSISDDLFSYGGWNADYGAYLVLKEILCYVEEPFAKNSFEHFKAEVDKYVNSWFYFQWDHIDFTIHLDRLASENPRVHSRHVRAGLISCLKSLFSEIDKACSGMVNHQFELNRIFGQLRAIGFILRETHLSPALRKKGEAIVNDSFPRFGSGVALYLRREVDELLELLEKEF